MIKDIKKVAYMDVSKSGDWYVWNEFCDKCGKQFRDYSIFSGDKSDENKNDYCVSCLRKMLDDMIKNKGDK